MLILIDQILALANVFVTTIALVLGLHYNLQMFQQNGYKNGEFWSWLIKNDARQRFLTVVLLDACVMTFFQHPVVDLVCLIIAIPWTIAIIFTYALYWRTETKKKLVVTARVKRLIATIVIVYAVLFVVCHERVVLLAMLYLSVLPYIVILCNLINHPIEAGINRHYIRDAQRIIRENPRIKIIGITGSYGKTSMKYYLNTLLKDFYDVLITPGNFNTTLGVVRTIREHLKPSNQIFLCEMGARHVHDIKEICDLFPPQEGIITSIGPQHLETLKFQC